MKDEDPYVQKTAAVCVAKLFDINPQLVEDQGFIDQLKDLLTASNPMVGGSVENRTHKFALLRNLRLLYPILWHVAVQRIKHTFAKFITKLIIVIVY